MRWLVDSKMIMDKKERKNIFKQVYLFYFTKLVLSVGEVAVRAFLTWSSYATESTYLPPSYGIA